MVNEPVEPCVSLGLAEQDFKVYKQYFKTGVRGVPCRELGLALPKARRGTIARVGGPRGVPQHHHAKSPLKNGDLQRVYAPPSRIPEVLEPLRKKVEECMKKAGLAAGDSQLDPEGLRPHKQNAQAVVRSFCSEAGFVASLDKACREFFDRSAATGTSSTKSFSCSGGMTTRCCARTPRYLRRRALRTRLSR